MFIPSKSTNRLRTVLRAGACSTVGCVDQGTKGDNKSLASDFSHELEAGSIVLDGSGACTRFYVSSPVAATSVVSQAPTTAHTDPKLNKPPSKKSGRGRGSNAAPAPYGSSEAPFQRPGEDLGNGIDMDGVQFLAAKKKLKALVVHLQAKLIGDKGYVNTLKGLNRKMKSKKRDETDLPMPTDKLLEMMGVQKTLLDGVKTKIFSCIQADFDANYAEYNTATAGVRTIEKKFTQQYAALQFKISDGSSDDKSYYGKEYWQYTRVSMAFVKGGHRDNLAKYWGKRVCLYNTAATTKEAEITIYGNRVQVDPGVAQFNKDVAALWHRAAMGDEHFVLLKAFIDAHMDNAMSKVESVVDSYQGNARWLGSYGAVQGTPLTAEVLGHMFSYDVMDMAGNDMWIICRRNNGKSTGSGQLPLAGLASLWVATRGIFLPCPAPDVRYTNEWRQNNICIMYHAHQ